MNQNVDDRHAALTALGSTLQMREFRWPILVFTFHLVRAMPTPGYNCSEVALADTCDDDCQYCQQQALLDYVWVLNGPNWHDNTGWPQNGTIGWSYTPLSHCEWDGVYCCGPDYTLLNVGDPAVRAYMLTNRTACEVPYGVAIILQGNNSLNGTISGALFSDSALRISLQILDLHSKPRFV